RQELGPLRRKIARPDDVQDAVAVLPIADTVHVVDSTERLGPVAENLFDLGARPDVELSFDTLAVGVFCGIETAIGTRHVAQDVITSAPRDVRKKSVAGDLVRVDVTADELRL